MSAFEYLAARAVTRGDLAAAAAQAAVERGFEAGLRIGRAPILWGQASLGFGIFCDFLYTTII